MPTWSSATATSWRIEHFSFVKKRLQRVGSWVVRQASDTSVPDATSGFRAYNREAALGLTVVSRFTYTLESLIQAGKSLVAVDHVVVGTNEQLRESRLFGSMWGYVRRNFVAIFRIYTGYEPLKVFTGLALRAAPAEPARVVAVRRGTGSSTATATATSSRSWSAASCWWPAVQAFALGVIADLIAAHRIVSQRTLERVRRIELELGVEPSHYVLRPGADASVEPISPEPRNVVAGAAWAAVVGAVRRRPPLPRGSATPGARPRGGRAAGRAACR